MKIFTKTALMIVGLLSFLLSFVFLWCFKVFYLDCPEEFNGEDVCFDRMSGVVYHDQSFYWLPIGLFFLILAMLCLILGWKMFSVRDSRSELYLFHKNR